MGAACLYCKNFDNLPLFTYNGLIKLARVTKVYDGDTITIVLYNNGYKKYNLRMKGYDSPEMRPSRQLFNRDLHISAAKYAQQKLSSIILNKVVKIRFDKEEKYGRLMGTVFYNNININELMINRYCCKRYAGDTKSEYTNEELWKILHSDNDGE